ncbi:MAG: peptidylprolyl isomerase [Lepagella sp.]|jgi:peptidyl-prolyl cis-trans isomerase
MKSLTSKIAASLLALTGAGSLIALAQSPANNNIVDEIVWVVGDEAVFRSDIEEELQQLRAEGGSLPLNPYCVIPEQLAVQKLYLHQAKMDTIEAPEGQLNTQVDRRLDYFVAGLGSKEKVEQYFRKSFPELRNQLRDVMRTQYIIGQVQETLTKDVKATPSLVKKYFAALPVDSIPYVPLQVETQIIMVYPQVPQSEIDAIKDRLRDISERVNNGESDFSTQAIMYSEDGSNMQGGELGFHGRADWVPEFSNVAFQLSDPKKVSRIVETEYGYHIIQLIDKRGEQVNVRHILLRPHVSSADLEKARLNLDSLRKEIVGGKFTFDEAARYASHDKDTRNNRGVMMNQNTGSSRFEMQDLPPEVAVQVEKMQPGDISSAFVMKDPKRNQDVVAVVRLTSRTPGHRATLSEDYNMIKEMYLAARKQEVINEWVEKKISTTYNRIEDSWGNCEFQYKGWKK